MNVLAIEISTSSAKALVYSSTDGVKKVVSIPFDKNVCDVVSQDPEGIYKTLVQCIKQITALDNHTIDAIGICTTWHSLLFLDKNRNPLGRIYTWAHTKAGETVKKYRKDASLAQWLYNRTGCMMHSTYPLWQYIHFRDTNAEMFEKASYLSSQQEYIFEKLTGEVAISKSIASGSGFLNIHTLDWDEEILEFASIKREQLSPLKDPTYAAPLKNDIAKELNLTSGIPVVIGGPDGALNQIGAGAVKEDVMTFSVGTSGALRLVSEESVLPSNPSTWCYYLAEGKRIVGAATAGAGNCVDWFVRSMSLKSELKYKDLDDAIKVMDKKEAPLFLPFLYGERCPGWRDDRLGGFYDLNGKHGIGDMYYAVLEGILFNLYHCYTILTNLLNPPKEARISGGITHSKEWLQMAADIFQTPMVTSDIEHASLLGIAVLTLNALGNIQDLQNFEPTLGEKIIPSKDSKDLYLQRYQRYLEIYEKQAAL
jgi:gluconokinase